MGNLRWYCLLFRICWKSCFCYFVCNCMKWKFKVRILWTFSFLLLFDRDIGLVLLICFLSMDWYLKDKRWKCFALYRVHLFSNFYFSSVEWMEKILCPKGSVRGDRFSYVQACWHVLASNRRGQMAWGLDAPRKASAAVVIFLFCIAGEEDWTPPHFLIRMSVMCGKQHIQAGGKNNIWDWVRQILPFSVQLLLPVVGAF